MRTMLRTTCRMRSQYTAAIKVLPAHALAWYNRGICRERLGDAAAALDDFTQAIQRAEASKNYPIADFYHNRAFCRRKLADFAGAIDDYSSALKLDPSHFKALSTRAFCLDVLGATPRSPPRLRGRSSSRGVRRHRQPRRRPREVGLEDAVEAFDAPSTAACRRTPVSPRARNECWHRGDHAAAVAAFSASSSSTPPPDRPSEPSLRPPQNRDVARAGTTEGPGRRADGRRNGGASAKLEKFDAAVLYTGARGPANAPRATGHLVLG